MATHSSILVWRISRTEEPGGLQPRGSQELDMTKPLNHHYVPGTSRGVIMLLGSLMVIYKKYMFSQKTAAAAKSRQSCPTLCDHRWKRTRLLCPWDSPGKNTGVGCHFLLHPKD